MDGNITKFSSPMPAIGMYMAGATLVCLLLMLCDIFNAIRQKKPWIPCQLFVFNSFTLALVSVATKLSGDLTTSMPSAYDQLSKLSGTSFICVSIAFFRPSVVNMSESELSTNLASLTVVVITVVVDVSMQISTGAIFLFKIEHILTLLLMLLLLGIMGCFRLTCADCVTEPWRKSLRHMPRNIHTLKRCYIHSYITEPQLMLCRFSQSTTVGILCTISFAVLFKAAIRAYCLDQGLKGGSDYKWSVGTVVVLQILAALAGTLAVVFRCLALARQMQSFLLPALKNNTILECHTAFLFTHRNRSLYSETSNHSRVIFQIFRKLQNILYSSLFLMRLWADCVNMLILIVIKVVGDCIAWIVRTAEIIDFGIIQHKGVDGVCDNDDKIMVKLQQEFDDGGFYKHKSPIPDFYSNYLLRKSVMDMEMCIKKHSNYPMHSVLKFLGRSANHGSVELLKQIDKTSDELLLLVCLIRIVDSLTPSFRTVSLVCALDQVFDIIVFIHEKINTTSVSKTIKINVAKDIWMSKNIKNHWFQTDIIKCLEIEGCTNHIQDHISGPVDKFLLNFVIHEVYDVINIIGEPRVDTVSSSNGHREELYDRSEQLFVELLHSFIDRLPDVIFNSLNENVPAVEFQKHAKTSMELVARFKQLDAKSLCSTSNINNFMTTDMAKQETEPVVDVYSLGNKNHVV
ncbi:hypothetical protein Sjap_008519 [Stephania japonica]|uniref:Uncharacterized protein n=1 Tax=Stephania japonica TaxID=461633 RepID=A0AAP0JRX8_9MAGN